MAFSWTFRVSSFEGFNVYTGSLKRPFILLMFHKQIDSVVPDPLHWPFQFLPLCSNCNLQLFIPIEVNRFLEPMNDQECFSSAIPACIEYQGSS